MEQQETTGINHGGRPTKYKPSFNKKARDLALLGCTDKQLAEFFDVSVDTINEWKKTYSRFSESLQGGKINADANVAAALYKRAIGYKYSETTYEKVDFKKALDVIDDQEIISDVYKKKIVVKELAPDIGAITLWLKNRQKDLWRERELKDLSEEDLEVLYQKLLNDHLKNRQ